MAKTRSGDELKRRFEEGRDELAKVFESEDSVSLAYVFGSMARGEAGTLSDVDLAVYLDESVPEDRYFDVKMDLLERSMDVLGDEVDLVVMNSASPLMNYNIVSKGELLYEKPRVRVAIEARTVDTFLDRKPYEERHARHRLEKIAREGLG